MTRRLRAISLLCLLLCAPAAAKPAPTWKDRERLVKQDRRREAAELLPGLRAAAQQKGDEEAVVRALVREAYLRQNLGEPEAAVRLLQPAEGATAPKAPRLAVL